MGGRSEIARAWLTLAVACTLAMPAAGQFSDSFNFIKAVRDGEGDKVMTYLNKPGQPVLNTRDGSTGETALHIVVKKHDQTWLGFLLARGAQTELRDREGNTALLTAVHISDADAARMLLQYGAKVNATNSRGETPLVVAVQHRDLPSIRLLVTNGADPRIADTIAGKNARDYASEDNRGTAILRILDEAKPKPSTMVGPAQ